MLGFQVPLRRPQVDLPECLTRSIALHAKLGDVAPAFRQEQLQKIKNMAGKDPASSGVKWETLQRLTTIAKLQDADLARNSYHSGGAMLAGEIPRCDRWPLRDKPDLFFRIPDYN